VVARKGGCGTSTLLCGEVGGEPLYIKTCNLEIDVSCYHTNPLSTCIVGSGSCCEYTRKI
jgi:hypothetical protein